MIIIGIDPGLAGGICILGCEHLNGHYARPFKTITDIKWLLDTLKEENKLNEIKAYVEEPPVFFKGAGGGLASQAKLHRNFGEYLGILMGLEISFETVRPQVWQKGLPGLTKLSGKDRKNALKNLAVQRFPYLKPTLSTCDAILIAEYGVKQTRAEF